MSCPSLLFLNSLGVPNSFHNILILAEFSEDFGVSLYCTMHPFRSRLFGFLIPPARRSRGMGSPISLKRLPCSFEPDPCPENRTQKIFGTRPCPNEIMTGFMV